MNIRNTKQIIFMYCGILILSVSSAFAVDITSDNCTGEFTTKIDGISYDNHEYNVRIHFPAVGKTPVAKWPQLKYAADTQAGSRMVTTALMAYLNDSNTVITCDNNNSTNLVYKIMQDSDTNHDANNHQ